MSADTLAPCEPLRYGLKTVQPLWFQVITPLQQHFLFYVNVIVTVCFLLFCLFKANKK